MKYLKILYPAVFLFVVFAWFNCSSATDPDDPTKPTGPQFITATNNNFLYSGRFMDAQYEGVAEKRSTWPGTTVRFTAKLSQLTIKLREAGENKNRYKILVDGQVNTEITPIPGQVDYDITANFDTTVVHEFAIYKVSENTGSYGAFQGIIVDENAVLQTTSPRAHTIEFIGDSYTVGYGNMSASRSGCNVWETTDNYFSYARMLADYFDADYMMTTWSGRGMVQNYGETSPNVNGAMPVLSQRILQNIDTPLWDYSYQPELVVIFLGLNDYSTEGDPSEELYKSTYANFVDFLRSKYSNQTKYLCLGIKSNNLEKIVANFVDEQLGEGKTDIGYAEFQYSTLNGCDWHPDKSCHEFAFNKLKTPITEFTGWTPFE